MPARRQDLNREGATIRAEISAALRTGQKQLRSRRATVALSRTFYIPALAGALWIGLSRFTLLELPRWPVLILPGLWALALLIWIRAQKPTESECARYIDNRLGLDERLTTYLELEARARYGLTPYASFLDKLGGDTALALKQASFAEQVRPSLRLKPAVSVALVASLAVLLGAILLPTALDAVRAEKKALQASLTAQVNNIEALRAELVARPGLPDSLKQTLDAQLRDLEAKLRNGEIDRSDALASLAATEEQLRGLMPDMSSSQFEPFIRAAQLVQAGATQSADWDPSLATSADDLGKASEALNYTKDYVNQFTDSQTRAMANAVERASDVVQSLDAGLSQDLVNAGTNLRKGDHDTARTELDAASQRFKEAQQEQQSALAVENALAKLSDGRQEIAKAGTTATKRQQVGFRRSQTAAQATGTATPDASAAASGQQGGTGNGTPAPAVGSNSALGQVLGQNQPAFGVKSGQGSAGTNGQTTGSGSNANPSTSGQGGGAGSGQPGATRSGAANGAGSASGGGSGNNGSGGQQGSVSGQINGPVRVGGASGGGGEAAGNGEGSASTQQQSQASGGSTEQLYVPGYDPSQQSGGAGQAAPEQPNGVGGRVGTGEAGSQKASDPGLGQLNTIRTPYNEVLGQYTQEATQALDKEYIPPDAKQYVRDYFTQLAK